MTKILLKGGRLIDPSDGTDDTLDLLVVDGKIASRGRGIEPPSDALVIDAAGKVVAPGLVDMHVHLREPGREDEETIASGARAAAHGGVTSVAAMPNTDPPIDTPSWVEYVRNARAAVRVHPIAAITVGREGKNLTEMAELAAAGAVAFSDDGSPVRSALVMRRALEYSAMIGRPIVSHCEDPDLAGSGVMHEGLASTIAGLTPVPAAAEEVAVARDIILAAATGARLHIAHVSTAGSVELIRRAKADGIAVTCETCPHYFTLTDNDVRSYDTNLRVNPPLRSEADVAAIVNGISDGTIDAIASDHAPHSIEEKQVEFDAAPPGMIGLETLFPLTTTRLVQSGTIDLPRALELLSTGPASILGIEAGTLTAGVPADVAVIDAGWTWKLSSDWIRSKSKNSPFVGATLLGRVVLTLSRGEIVFEEERHADGSAGPNHSEAPAERQDVPVRS